MAISKTEIMDILERFLKGTLGSWAWDDLISAPIKDQELESVHKELLKIRSDFPSGAMGAWCSREGVEQIKRLYERLSGKA
jgi:hypothetical protein